jgi:adenylate kinase
MLSQCLAAPHISTGDMLRDLIRLNEADAKLVAKMQSGGLVRDEIVNRMVEERLSQPDAAEGFVLDGYPRTRPQAEHLSRWLDARGVREVVIYLAVDYNVVIARLTGRRQCPRCGTLYNLATKRPRVDETCDRDGEKLVIRADDNETVIRERLDAYQRQTQPVLDYFREAGRQVVEVNASYDPPEKVFKNICNAMDCHDCPKDRR